MTAVHTMLLLALAALLEVGGDAVVRLGVRSHFVPARIGFVLLGACVLGAYGVTVNLPPWDFGRLLGVYVVLFFLIAQIINYAGFGLAPTLPILAGGALIVAGGLVIALWPAR